MVIDLIERFVFSEKYKENLKFVGKETLWDTDWKEEFEVSVYKDVSFRGHLSRGLTIIGISSAVIIFGTIIVDGIITKIESEENKRGI